jgi:putative flippase GtrA
MQSFLRFGVLSGGGWLLDAALLLLLSQAFGVPLAWANVISSITAALAVFTISRLLIFTPAVERPWLRTLMYASYTLAVIAVASAAIGPVAAGIQRAFGYFAFAPSAGAISFLAKVVITPPQLLANFFMARYLAERNL